MGVQITELVEGKEVSLEDLKNKTFAVDSYNLLYQFLSSIRQPDGSLLTDSKGRVTSHLQGLFSRITRLMAHNMRFIFCFDGKVPDLKFNESVRRKGLKDEALRLFEEAKSSENIDDMKKYAARTSRLTKEMVEDAKELILALGQVVVEAPSEGEAQASFMVKKGDADFVISQDADCLLFGAPRMVKNLTITGKRKRPGAYAYDDISPEVITLRDVLQGLALTQDQLIVLGILVGTDYNPGGIKGIGPKKALALLKKHGDDFEAVFEEAKWGDAFSIAWQVVFDTIKGMGVREDYVLGWKPVDREKLIDILVRNHDFAEERVLSTISRLEESTDRKQKGLGDFF
jgi:flap endonuclease-1